MKTDAVIVAAGNSTRFGSKDKLFADLGGRPLVGWSVCALLAADGIGGILIVGAEHNLEELETLGTALAGHRFLGVVPGGSRRSESVAAGLERVASNYAAIHDGARPLVQPADIDRCVRRAHESTGGAILAVPVTDTIKVVRDGKISGHPDRATLWAAQTPQVVNRKHWLYAAALSDNEETDDAAMLGRVGLDVAIVEGDAANIKVTRPTDLTLAHSIARERGWL